MSTHLEYQLDSGTVTLEQKFLLPKNATIEQFALKLDIFNNPAGNFILSLKRGVAVIEAMTLTSAIINTKVLTQTGSSLDYKAGYFIFEPVFPLNLRRNVEYTLELSTTGYTFSASASIAWIVEYLNETNLLLDAPDTDLGKALSYRLHGFNEYGGFVMPRTANFFDGQQSATAPDLGTLNRTVTGSQGAPILITAGGGITPLLVPVEMIFVAGDSGPIDITVNPQIAAGNTVGQELNIYGTSDVDTVLLEDGNGLSLNGAISLDSETNITLIWTGTVWKQSGSFGA